MIETNETGQKQMEELLLNKDDEVFDDWEKRFIQSLRGKRYEALSKHQRTVVTRLIGWLRGK